jgi:uncharacterized protein (DUF486 family)
MGEVADTIDMMFEYYLSIALFGNCFGVPASRFGSVAYFSGSSKLKGKK